MKKTIVIIMSLLLVSSAVAWNSNPTYNPFEVIWNAINDLVSRVDGINDNVDEINTKIDLLELSSENSYDNLIIVAKSGGDFTSVQDAIDSIDDASEDNKYLVWVASGEYRESVTLKKYVYLKGASKTTTIISVNGSSVITAAEDSGIEDLTINVDSGGTVTGVFVDTNSFLIENINMIFYEDDTINARGILVSNVSILKINNLNIDMDNHHVIAYGIDLQDSSMELRNSNIKVDGAGYGIKANSDVLRSVEISNLNVVANVGLKLDNYWKVNMKDSNVDSKVLGLELDSTNFDGDNINIDAEMGSGYNVAVKGISILGDGLTELRNSKISAHAESSESVTGIMIQANSGDLSIFRGRNLLIKSSSLYTDRPLSIQGDFFDIEHSKLVGDELRMYSSQRNKISHSIIKSSIAGIDVTCLANTYDNHFYAETCP